MRRCFSPGSWCSTPELRGTTSESWCSSSFSASCLYPGAELALLRERFRDEERGLSYMERHGGRERSRKGSGLVVCRRVGRPLLAPQRAEKLGGMHDVVCRPGRTRAQNGAGR